MTLNFENLNLKKRSLKFNLTKINDNKKET